MKLILTCLLFTVLLAPFLPVHADKTLKDKNFYIHIDKIRISFDGVKENEPKFQDEIAAYYLSALKRELAKREDITLSVPGLKDLKKSKKGKYPEKLQRKIRKLLKKYNLKGYEISPRLTIKAEKTDSDYNLECKINTMVVTFPGLNMMGGGSFSSTVSYTLGSPKFDTKRALDTYTFMIDATMSTEKENKYLNDIKDFLKKD